MAIKQLTLPGSIVKKDNALVRSRTSITNITASRFAASLIAQINIDDVDFKKEYSIDVRKEVDIFVDAGVLKCINYVKLLKLYLRQKSGLNSRRKIENQKMISLKLSYILQKYAMKMEYYMLNSIRI